MKSQIKSILVILTFCISTISEAQSLKVVSFRKNLDPMYVGMQKKDLNGDICAIVKVQLPVPGVKFEGNVIASEFDINEYLVYMSAGSKKLTIKCPHTNSLNIDFSSLANITSLETKGIYTLEVVVTQDKSTLNENNQLKIDYDQLVLKANESFNKRDFSSYRSIYDEAASLKYRGLFSISDFDKIVDVDTIVAAQSRFEAITPQLARAFADFDSFTIPSGFSEGVMVVDDERGNIALISTNGDKSILNNTFVQFPKIFKNGKLPILQNTEHRLINPKGISIIDYQTTKNNLFRKEDMNFIPLEHGYYMVFNRNNGKHGLLNSNGTTILPPTNKYDQIFPTENCIYLNDDRFIYRWSKVSGNLENYKEIFKIFPYKYKGSVVDITEDYVITLEWENKKAYIYPFYNEYNCSINAESIKSGNKDSVIVRYNHKSYIYNYTQDSIIELPYLCWKVDENMIFDGKDCYDLSGNLIFSLGKKHEFSRRGFTDGFLLVYIDGEYRYIDKEGRTLENSQFKLPGRAKDIIYVQKPFGDGFGIIYRDGYWGLVDKYGQTTFDYLK